MKRTGGKQSGLLLLCAIVAPFFWFILQLSVFLVVRRNVLFYNRGGAGRSSVRAFIAWPTHVICQRKRASCDQAGCDTRPTYGMAGRRKKTEFFSKHAKDGMFNIGQKKCGHPECTKRASLFGMFGSKKAGFHSQHARKGMVDVANNRCGHPGCTTRPSFGM